MIRLTRSRLVGLISVLALLGASGGLVALYYLYTAPIGWPPTGETVPPQCQISEAIRREARVSNPSLMQQPDPNRLELVRHTHCFWRQTVSADGNDRRILGIHVYDHTEPNHARESAESTYQSQRRANQRDVPNLGDRASVADRQPDNNMEVTLLVLQGTRVYKVIYRGADRGFFFDRPFPVQEGERITTKVVQELMGDPR